MNHGSFPTPQCRAFLKKLVDYTQQRNLPKGRSLHAHLIKTGTSSSNVFISNNLVIFYAKCHRLPQAHQAFQEIEPKTTISWNCLINAYSQMNTRDSAISVLRLFYRMRREDFLPDPRTLVGVFSAVSILEDPFVGEQAHVLTIKATDYSDVFVNSSLLNMYCKVGLLDKGRKVFDEMPERNSISWATMLSGYAARRLSEESFGLFRSMVREGEEDANEFVLTSVLSALTSDEFVIMGKQVHSLAFKYGLMSMVSVGNALITMYVKCGSLDDALWAFQLSGDKNSITWSAMITGYAQSGDAEKALDLFSEMNLCGMKPSEFTLVGVLSACGDTEALTQGKQVHGFLLKLGYDAHMYILTALADMYAKCGNMSDAQKGLDHLQDSDIVLWTSMISGYVQNGDNENALSLYCKMQLEGIIPNDLSMVSILKACSTLATLELGKQIHGQTVKFGFTLEAPLGSALTTMYTKCGSLEDGDRVFRRMPERDLVSWNSMISGLSHNGYGEKALELFEEMRLEGTEPDYVTFVNILSACSHMGLYQQGWNYFRMMADEFRIVPGLDHYACMVDIMGRAGRLHEAKEFIESITIDHGLCLWRILLSACRNRRNYELGAYAGEKLLELRSTESSAYILLSSIYSALGKLNDVERVRRMMNLRGVTKNPGCSWIELKNQVHVFVVGDLLHPEIDEICNELHGLCKLMKDEDYQPDADEIDECF